MKFEESNSRLRAFITVQRVRGRSKGRLAGLTFGIKDIIRTKGIRTTAGSKILSDYVPDANAYVVQRILDEGGTIEGKTNTHEFAIGATNTSSIAGPARNPRDVSRISGGSSGGSAVAVASGMVDVGIGTDTGGSVRIPAALCGVVGFKPTLGLISTEGVIPGSWSLDTLGVIARDIATARTVFDALTGPQAVSRPRAKTRRRPKLGLFLFSDDEVSKALQPTLRRLAKSFDLKEADFPLLRQKGHDVKRTLHLPEAASYHRSWMATRSNDYFPDVRRLMEIGLSIPAVDYVDSLRYRRLLVREYLEKMDGIDAVLSPTTKITAPMIEDVVGKEMQFRDTLVSNTELFNVVPAPSISIPAAESNGIQAGLMITGRLYQDRALLDIAERVAESLRSEQT